MATATKKVRAARPAGHDTADAALSVPSEFRVWENNSGEYRWAIFSKSGATLAESEPFATFDAARHAATCVRDGAAGAQFEAGAPDASSVAVA